MNLESAIFTGRLHHRRTAPKVHDFQYDVVYFYLDLSELNRIFNVPLFFSDRFPRLIGFNRNAYLAGAPSLDEAVRDKIEQQQGIRHMGPIRLLTQISYFGFCFNPVSFYYCFNPQGELQYIVGEITNTPWNERKSYVLKVGQAERGKFRFQFPKDFHVSPFMPMELMNHWSFDLPDPREHGKLWIHMEDHDLKTREKVFEATLSLKAKPMTRGNVLRTVLGYPLLTFKAFFAIYYQALILKLKRVPFYPHPKTKGPL